MSSARGPRAVLVGVLAGALVGTTIVAPPTHAQPDVARAKQLYLAAETAMTERRFADAIRDYESAYDLTKDPVLFYKLGSANEQAGKCDVALIYYGRYLREAQPSPQFLALVQERITACGGDPRNLGGGPPPAGSGTAATGSATDAGSSGSAATDTGSDTGSDLGRASGSAAVTAEPAPGAGSGSAAQPALPGRHQGPWIMIGGSIALLTIGAVLAYSANAAENDISDLYVGLGGTPPVFDDRTQQRYDDLLAEGRRYERLSWASFALAGGLGIGAAVWMYVTRDREARPVSVTPTASSDGAGVSATVRW